MDYNYTDSICFSAESAEKINRKAFDIDHRLFLFAYYEPKSYKEAESYRSRFVTAIINMYGLFKDCCPFLGKLLKTSESILIAPDWRAVQRNYYNMFSVVTSFRSILCHNHSTYYPLNEDNLQHVNAWIKQCLRGEFELEDVGENEWATLLRRLCVDADTLIKELSANLDQLLQPANLPRKNQAVARWVTAISNFYLRNPDYLLNAMAGMYQVYLFEIGQGVVPNITLRQQTLDWLKEYCVTGEELWFTYWLGKPNDNLFTSKLYAIINDWENQWAQWNGCDATECYEPPLPCGDLFRILAQDVYAFAKNPHLGYQQS